MKPVFYILFADAGLMVSNAPGVVAIIIGELSVIYYSAKIVENQIISRLKH